MSTSTAPLPLQWQISDDLTPYPDAIAAMQTRVAAIRAGTAPELVWLVEHPPLFTAGTSADPADLLNPQHFPTFSAGRGGQWTYHGPGQRTGYVMLDLTRQQVITFLRERRESWREDETNQDEHFQRNKIRHHILPLLESEMNPRIRTVLRRTADILREEDHWMDALASDMLAECRIGTDGLAMSYLQERNLAQRRRILRLWLAAAGVPVERTDFDTVDRIDRLLIKPAAPVAVPVAGAWIVTRRYGILTIRKGKAKTSRAFAIHVRIPGRTTVKHIGLNIVVSMAPGLIKDKKPRLGAFPAQASLRWAADENRKLTVRSWRPGDRMKPFGMKGSKKLQDIFVDAKVPIEERLRLPLFECNGEIIWLPGYRVARGWEVSCAVTPSLQVRVERCASWRE